MKSFVAMLLLSLCTFDLGNANEISNKALKTTREFKDQVKRLTDFLKLYALMYGAELNKKLDEAQNQYREKFDQEINSALADIKSAIALKKASASKECYEAATSRFDQLNVTSSKAVEQCSVNKKDGVDPDKVLDSIVTLVSHGKKLYEYVEKLEKEVEKSSESELKSFEDKRVPAVKSSVGFYDFAIHNIKIRAGKAIDESAKLAKECNDKELADVHVIALSVRENAYNCIYQA